MAGVGVGYSSPGLGGTLALASGGTLVLTGWYPSPVWEAALSFDPSYQVYFKGPGARYLRKNM